MDCGGEKNIEDFRHCTGLELEPPSSGQVLVTTQNLSCRSRL